MSSVLFALGTLSWGGIPVPDTLLLALASNAGRSDPVLNQARMMDTQGRSALCDSQMAMWSWSLRAASYKCPPSGCVVSPRQFPPEIPEIRLVSPFPANVMPLQRLRSFILGVRERRRQRREIKAEAEAEAEQDELEKRRAKVVSWYD